MWNYVLETNQHILSLWGFKRLEYRVADSAGLTILNGDGFTVKKKVKYLTWKKNRF